MPRSSRRSRKGRFTRNAIHHIDHAVSSFGRWVTTDHTGFTDAMLAMPKMGFLESLRYVLVQFVIRIGSAILAAVLFGLRQPRPQMKLSNFRRKFRSEFN